MVALPAGPEARHIAGTDAAIARASRSCPAQTRTGNGALNQCRNRRVVMGEFSKLAEIGVLRRDLHDVDLAAFRGGALVPV